MFNKLTNLATTTGLVTLGVAIITTRTAIKAGKECKSVAQHYIDERDARIEEKRLASLREEVETAGDNGITTAEEFIASRSV